jgi:hypothetical protein
MGTAAGRHAATQHEPRRMIGEMSWMMWAGLTIWLFVIALMIWAAVELVRYLRANRPK